MTSQTTKTQAQPQVHTFSSTGDCYDECQCRDDIHTGDVLVIPSESVVGILVEAWPVAITDGPPGALHQTMPGWDWASVSKTGGGVPYDLTASLALAQAEAVKLTQAPTIQWDVTLADEPVFHHLIEPTPAKPSQTVTIRYDGDEFRVPGPAGTEAQAYYTNDRQDAIATAREVFGRDAFLRIKRVACADPDAEI